MSLLSCYTMKDSRGVWVTDVFGDFAVGCQDHILCCDADKSNCQDLWVKIF